MYELGHFIDGKRVAGKSGRVSNIFNPATGEVQGTVALASDAELSAAVESAKAAQPKWAATNPQRRARVFMKFVELLNANMNELAEILSREHGKTIEDAKGDLIRGLEVCEFVIGIPHLQKSEFTEGAGPGIDMYSIRQAVGIGAGITPFNFPAMIPMWMFAPAIACGNAFILKPSERDPSVPIRLAELMIEAGLPAGILNVVNGDKGAVDAILTDPDIDIIDITTPNLLHKEMALAAIAHGKHVYCEKPLAPTVAECREMVEAGEVLVRRRLRRASDGLPVPLQLQVLEADFLDATKSGALGAGRLVQGIEFDPVGKRRAYWLHAEHPGDAYGALQNGLQSRPVPATEIAHVYEKQRTQARGVPWGAPVIRSLRDLDDYEVAELVRKKTEACVTAIVFGDDEAQQGIAPSVVDADGNRVEQFEPGLIAYARGGKDIRFNQPAATGGYGEYKRASLHTISAGFRVPYELLTGDLSQVNYSSIRAGLVEFRRQIDAVQWQLFIPMFCAPVWRWFTEAAWAAGQIPSPIVPVEWSPPSFEPDAFDAESEPAPEPAPPPFDEAFAPSAVAFAPFASEAPWSEPSALPPFDDASEPP